MAKKEKKQKKGHTSIVDTIVTQMTKHVGCVFAIVFVVSVIMIWM